MHIIRLFQQNDYEPLCFGRESAFDFRPDKLRIMLMPAGTDQSSAAVRFPLCLVDFRDTRIVLPHICNGKDPLLFSGNHQQGSRKDESGQVSALKIPCNVGNIIAGAAAFTEAALLNCQCSIAAVDSLNCNIFSAFTNIPLICFWIFYNT